MKFSSERVVIYMGKQCVVLYLNIMITSEGRRSESVLSHSNFSFQKSTPPECVLQDVQLSITRIRMSCKQKLKWSLFLNFFLSKFKMPATRSGKLITFHAIKYRSIYQRCIRNHMLKEGIHENTIEALVLVEIF